MKSDNLFYYMDVICDNCGHRSIEMIEKGVRLFDYLYTKECENCGCSELRRDLSKENEENKKWKQMQEAFMKDDLKRMRNKMRGDKE